MNTSGNSFRDHAGSMVSLSVLTPSCSLQLTFGIQDLCNAALQFGSIVLRTGGHFVCKFYQGVEDKELEKSLKMLFNKVHRLKPESSRSVSVTITITKKMESCFLIDINSLLND